MRTISFLKESETDNAYAKPIQGVISHVDLTLKEVACVEDFGVVPVPKAHARYDAESQSEFREQPKLRLFSKFRLGLCIIPCMCLGHWDNTKILNTGNLFKS